MPVGAALYGLVFAAGLVTSHPQAAMAEWYPYWLANFAVHPRLSFATEQQFFLFLAVAKLSGTFALWSANKTVSLVGNVILLFPAGLGAYMNYHIGDPAVVAAVLWTTGNLALLFGVGGVDGGTKGKKS